MDIPQVYHRRRSPFVMRILVAALLILCLGAMTACSLLAPAKKGDESPSAVSTSAAKIRHVFVIVLENKSYEDTFGSSRQDPYLQNTLVPMGGLLTQYYGTGHVSLDNYISMLSGQAPTPDTANDCLSEFKSKVANFTDVVQTGTTDDGQVIASHGCVYPATVKTLADQLDASGLSWRGYMEDMGNDPRREAATCGHPAIGEGTDLTHSAEAPSAEVPLGDAYAARHNPFVYFHSIIDNTEACGHKVVNLDHLDADLGQVATTPNFVFITPNLCSDGHDGKGTGDKGTTCADGRPGGLTTADAFLKAWVPKILQSPAYQQDGLLIITFDEGNYEQTRSVDAQTGRVTATLRFPGVTCCKQQPGPNLAASRPGSFVIQDTPKMLLRAQIDGYGGDRIGALLLSPYVKPGSRSDTPYNHYALLRSLEDIFRLDRHLGYAADNPDRDYHLDTIGNDGNVFMSE